LCGFSQFILSFIGWIYDQTSNYDYAFYFAGAPPIIGAAIIFFLPKIKSRVGGSRNQWSPHNLKVSDRHQPSSMLAVLYIVKLFNYG